MYGRKYRSSQRLIDSLNNRWCQPPMSWNFQIKSDLRNCLLTLKCWWRNTFFLLHTISISHPVILSLTHWLTDWLTDSTLTDSLMFYPQEVTYEITCMWLLICVLTVQDWNIFVRTYISYCIQYPFYVSIYLSIFFSLSFSLTHTHSPNLSSLSITFPAQAAFDRGALNDCLRKETGSRRWGGGQKEG